MPQSKVGSVSVELPFALPARAGELSPAEVARLVRPPHDLQTACDDVATAIDGAGALLTLPPEVTAEALREAGKLAADMERFVQQGKALMERMGQANLMLHHDAYVMLCKVNDAVRSQGKHNRGLLTAFSALSRYMARKSARPAPQPTEKETLPG